MKRLVRYVLAGCIGAIVGWFIFEPWKDDFGHIRDFLLLYSVSLWIAFGMIIQKFFFAGTSMQKKVGWTKETLKKKHLYVIPLIGVIAIKVIFYTPVEIQVQADTQIETRLLLLDTSGSMCGSPLKELKEAVDNYLGILEKAKSQDIIGCIAFSDGAQLDSSLSTNYAQMKKDVKSLECAGGTNMLSAFQLASETLRGQEGYPQEIILLSDGEPNDRGEVINYLTNLKKIPVHTVGAGGDYDRALLENISTRTGGKFYSADDISHLTKVFIEIAQQGITETSDKKESELQAKDQKSTLPFWKRFLGWSICGLLIGLTIGIGEKRGETIIIGSVGGCLGGTLSSICFMFIDMLNIASGSSTRFVSFALLGACIGFTIFVVEFIYSKIKPADTRFDVNKIKVR